MSFSHASAWRIVRLLRMRRATLSRTRGAMSAIACPWIQRSLQKRTLCPLPTSIQTMHSNTSQTSGASNIGMPCHGLLGSILVHHSHLTLGASPYKQRFLTPRPPKRVGLQIVSQATRHWPPLHLSFPAQKKDLYHLFISSSTHCGASTTMR